METHRPGHPPQLYRARRLELELVANRLPDDIAHRNRARHGCAFDTGRLVGGGPDRLPLIIDLGDQHRPGVDPDPHLEDLVVDNLDGPRQWRSAPQDRQARENRPARIILVRVVEAEMGHQPVAHAGRERTPVAADRSITYLMKDQQNVAPPLGVERLSQRCRLDDVDRHQGQWPLAVEASTSGGRCREIDRLGRHDEISSTYVFERPTSGLGQRVDLRRSLISALWCALATDSSPVLACLN